MTPLIALTWRFTSPDSKPQYEAIRLNSAAIAYVFPTSDSMANIVLIGGGEVPVVESPDEIARLIDPEGFCADGPQCGYYLSYLAWGPADLTHAGYHARVEISNKHINPCTVTERTGQQCERCNDHERALRY